MELDKAIKKRTSIKKFSNKKPDWRDILEAIDAARLAPMAGNIYSLRFLIIDDKNKIQSISDCCQQDFVSQAPYLIIVCSDEKKTKNSFEERADKYLRQQAGAAIQNFLLKIEESGLATCWVGHLSEKLIKEKLGIPNEIEIEAVLPIGYESKEKGSKKRTKDKIDLDRILYFNSWGNRKMGSPKVVKTNA